MSQTVADIRARLSKVTAEEFAGLVLGEYAQRCSASSYSNTPSLGGRRGRKATFRRSVFI